MSEVDYEALNDDELKVELKRLRASREEFTKLQRKSGSSYVGKTGMDRKIESVLAVCRTRGIRVNTKEVGHE